MAARPCTQPTCPYQANGLACICEECGRPRAADQAAARAMLAGTGCEVLLG